MHFIQWHIECVNESTLLTCFVYMLCSLTDAVTQSDLTESVTSWSIFTHWLLCHARERLFNLSCHMFPSLIWHALVLIASIELICAFSYHVMESLLVCIAIVSWPFNLPQLSQHCVMFGVLCHRNLWYCLVSCGVLVNLKHISTFVNMFSNMSGRFVELVLTTFGKVIPSHTSIILS